MKLTKITSALTALAAVAVLSATAHAQTAYQEGDLLLGFEQGNGAGGVTTNNYIVDLGAISQFINASGSLTFNISTTDLTTAFGSNWANNSPSGSTVQWGLFAGSNSSGNITVGGVTLKKNTLFYSVGETVPGTQSTPPTTASNSSQGSINNSFQGLALAFAGATTTSPSSNAAIVASSTYWSAFSPSTAAFGGAGNIEQPNSGSFTGPTNSVLDLYQLNNNTQTPGSVAKDLGTFSLASSGVLTFNSAVAVPEPSTYALGLVAMALMVVLVRRQKSNASLE